MEISLILQNFLMATGYAVIVLSVIPLIRWNYWFIRIFDYPRSQKFWITLSILIIFSIIADYSSLHHEIFLVLLFLNCTYLLTQIWSYTPLASIQMKKNREVDGPSIKLMIANVFQDNKDVVACTNLIKTNDPDIVLLVETDERWRRDIEDAVSGYPYRILQPQDNTYGMLLFSKLKIERHTIRFLVEKDIPSITADMTAQNGQRFRLYCLHPKPPVPNESKESTDRDAEILIVGKEAKKCKIPAIVAGDLNDVAWSYTTNLFLKVSGLLDPRIGRGFFSTFHAAYPFFRWPLDHVFCSPHFYLRSLKRLPFIGSDHFPIFIDVALMPYEPEENLEQKEEADHDDLQLADEKIEQARS